MADVGRSDRMDQGAYWAKAHGLVQVGSPEWEAEAMREGGSLWVMAGGDGETIRWAGERARRREGGCVEGLACWELYGEDEGKRARGREGVCGFSAYADVSLHKERKREGAKGRDGVCGRTGDSSEGC
jgi:hypothetical protein